MPSGTAIICPQCGQRAIKATGSVNRSRAKGAPIYCGKACSGIARRDLRSDQQRRDAKADYDQRRREQLGEALLEAKRAAYRNAVENDTNRLRASQKAQREQRREQHLSYCRTPNYREWKSGYDRRHRAEKEYGPFADAALTLLALQEEINSRSTWLERAAAKGTLCKSQQRKRQYGKSSIKETVRGQSEGRALGHPPVDPERSTSARRR